MKKKIMKILAGILLLNLFGVCEEISVIVQAEAVQEKLAQPSLILHDLSSYEESLQLELEWMEESLEESEQWKESAYLLNVETYPWVTEARELLKTYFSDKYGMDISEKTDGMEVYASPDIPEVLVGFSAGDGNVYINERDLDKEADKLLHYTLHECIHALGVDFYQDESKMLSNAFYEGITETLTQEILKTYGYDEKKASGYEEIVDHVGKILESDPEYLPDMVTESTHDIAGKIDEKLGEGIGKRFLEALTLIGSGEEDEKIEENCDWILDAYFGQ